jgi:hypothetical protein
MPDKIQQEIEELLQKLDHFPPRRPLWVRVRDGITGVLQGVGSLFTGIRLPRMSAGHILLLGIGVIVIAFWAEPGGESVTKGLTVGGIIVFIGAFVLSLRRQSKPPEQLWRGKPLDLQGPSGRARSRSWWDRRRRR